MLQLSHGNNLHTTKKRLQLHNNIMRAYIEPRNEDDLFLIIDEIDNETYKSTAIPFPALPWTIEIDNPPS